MKLTYAIKDTYSMSKMGHLTFIVSLQDYANYYILDTAYAMANLR